MNKQKSLIFSDYKRILKFYKIPIPSTLRKTKGIAEKVLIKKLCGCIKKVNATQKHRKKQSRKKNKGETFGIGVCRKSVMTKKRLGFYQFTCRKTRKFKAKKGKNNLYKIDSTNI